MDTPHRKNEKEVLEAVKHMEDMVGWATSQFRFLYPVKLVAFPECMMGFWYLNNKDYVTNKVAIEIPGSEASDRIGEVAKKFGIYLSAGTWYEKDPKWPLCFNTNPVFGPDGKLLFKYRKVNTWMPDEMMVSPHELLPAGYKEELFPVAKTPIGNIGVGICYDQMHPEVWRQLAANGAEILIKASAYMDPWGNEPTDWWEISTRYHSAANLCYSVACQQGSDMKTYYPFSWSGSSMIVDYEGRMLTRALSGERIVGARIDIDALRSHRATVTQHAGLSHLRSEAYDYLKKTWYPSHPECAKRDDINPDGVNAFCTLARDDVRKRLL
jgi:formamidase